MSQVTYMRALISVKCISCKYDGYDSEFENLVSGEIIKGEPPNLDSELNIHNVMVNNSGEYQIIYKNIICPNCKKENSMDEIQ